MMPGPSSHPAKSAWMNLPLHIRALQTHGWVADCTLPWIWPASNPNVGMLRGTGIVTRAVIQVGNHPVARDQGFLYPRTRGVGVPVPQFQHPAVLADARPAPEDRSHELTAVPAAERGGVRVGRLADHATVTSRPFQRPILFRRISRCHAHMTDRLSSPLRSFRQKLTQFSCTTRTSHSGNRTGKSTPASSVITGIPSPFPDVHAPPDARAVVGDGELQAFQPHRASPANIPGGACPVFLAGDAFSLARPPQVLAGEKQVGAHAVARGQVLPHHTVNCINPHSPGGPRNALGMGRGKDL